MPVEPREAGKWRRTSHDPGPPTRRETGASDGDPSASTSRTSPRPLVVGGTFGLDQAHAQPARTKRADNQMVSALGQSYCGQQSPIRLLGGLAQRRCPRSRWPKRRAVQRAGRSRTGQTTRRTAQWALPTPSRQTGLDTQTGHDREATVRNSDGEFILHLAQQRFGMERV